MKNSILLFILCFLVAGCNKDPKLQDIFGALTIEPNEVLADGRSLITVSVEVKESSADRRNVVFSTSAGTFTTSGTTKQTVKAEYENGVLKATAMLRAPLKAATMEISAQLEFDSPVGDFTTKGTATALFSEPATIYIIPSVSGLASNHLNEVLLTGILKNEKGNFVSSGVGVRFDDELLSGLPAGGVFRNLQTTTADSSKVSASYSAPMYPIGTRIKIRSTVLDANGQLTNIKDSIFLTINQ